MAADSSAIHRRLQIATIAAAVAFGAIVLFVAMGEEPYHIDELRQVRSYSSDLVRVAKLSVG